MNNQPIVRLCSLPVTINQRSKSYNMRFHCKATYQSGAVLIISLIMLLLLTLIATTGMQTTSLEEKMAGNLRNKDLSFQAAESALKAAEASIAPPAVLPAFTLAGTGGFYLDNTPGTPNPIPTATAILTDAFWTNNPVATSTVSGLGNGIAAPVYIIQQLPAACFNPAGCLNLVTNPLSQVFKITVRATGSSNAVVILQSINAF